MGDSDSDKDSKLADASAKTSESEPEEGATKELETAKRAKCTLSCFVCLVEEVLGPDGKVKKLILYYKDCDGKLFYLCASCKRAISKGWKLETAPTFMPQWLQDPKFRSMIRTAVNVFKGKKTPTWYPNEVGKTYECGLETQIWVKLMPPSLFKLRYKMDLDVCESVVSADSLSNIEGEDANYIILAKEGLEAKLTAAEYDLLLDAKLFSREFVFRGEFYVNKDECRRGESIDTYKWIKDSVLGKRPASIRLSGMPTILKIDKLEANMVEFKKNYQAPQPSTNPTSGDKDEKDEDEEKERSDAECDSDFGEMQMAEGGGNEAVPTAKKRASTKKKRNQPKESAASTIAASEKQIAPPARRSQMRPTLYRTLGSASDLEQLSEKTPIKKKGFHDPEAQDDNVSLGGKSRGGKTDLETASKRSANEAYSPEELITNLRIVPLFKTAIVPQYFGTSCSSASSTAKRKKGESWDAVKGAAEVASQAMIVVKKEKALDCVFSEYKTHCEECWKVVQLRECETIHINITSVAARRYAENDLLIQEAESFGSRMSLPGEKKGTFKLDDPKFSEVQVNTSADLRTLMNEYMYVLAGGKFKSLCDEFPDDDSKVRIPQMCEIVIAQVPEPEEGKCDEVVFAAAKTVRSIALAMHTLVTRSPKNARATFLAVSFLKDASKMSVAASFWAGVNTNKALVKEIESYLPKASSEQIVGPRVESHIDYLKKLLNLDADHLDFKVDVEKYQTILKDLSTMGDHARSSGELGELLGKALEYLVNIIIKNGPNERHNSIVTHAALKSLEPSLEDSEKQKILDVKKTRKLQVAISAKTSVLSSSMAKDAITDSFKELLPKPEKVCDHESLSPEENERIMAEYTENVNKYVSSVHALADSVLAGKAIVVDDGINELAVRCFEVFITAIQCDIEETAIHDTKKMIDASNLCSGWMKLPKKLSNYLLLHLDLTLHCWNCVQMRDEVQRIDWNEPETGQEKPAEESQAPKEAGEPEASKKPSMAQLMKMTDGALRSLRRGLQTIQELQQSIGKITDVEEHASVPNSFFVSVREMVSTCVGGGDEVVAHYAALMEQEHLRRLKLKEDKYWFLARGIAATTSNTRCKKHWYDALKKEEQKDLQKILKCGVSAEALINEKWKEGAIQAAIKDIDQECAQYKKFLGRYDAVKEHKQNRDLLELKAIAIVTREEFAVIAILKTEDTETNKSAIISNKFMEWGMELVNTPDMQPTLYKAAQDLKIDTQAPKSGKKTKKK